VTGTRSATAPVEVHAAPSPDGADVILTVGTEPVILTHQDGVDLVVQLVAALTTTATRQETPQPCR